MVETDKTTFTKAGETAKIKAAITPANTTDKTLKYSSSDEKVAKVDANGTATITVKTVNGLSKSITVEVILLMKEISQTTVLHLKKLLLIQ